MSMTKARVRTQKVTKIVSRQDLADWFWQHGHSRVRVRMSILQPNVGYAYLPYRLKEIDKSFLMMLVDECLLVGSHVVIIDRWWSWFWRGVIGMGH